jgi:hypothetical protein
MRKEARIATRTEVRLIIRLSVVAGRYERLRNWDPCEI